MLDLCDAVTLEQGAVVPQQLVAAGQTAGAAGTGTNLAAHVVVRRPVKQLLRQLKPATLHHFL